MSNGDILALALRDCQEWFREPANRVIFLSVQLVLSLFDFDLGEIDQVFFRFRAFDEHINNTASPGGFTLVLDFVRETEQISNLGRCLPRFDSSMHGKPWNHAAEIWNPRAAQILADGFLTIVRYLLKETLVLVSARIFEIRSRCLQTSCP